MNDVWVLAEAGKGSLRECALEVIDEGRRLAEDLHSLLTVLLLGEETARLAVQAGEYDVDAIIRIEHPLLHDYDAETWTSVLSTFWVKAPPRLLLISATPNGQDLAPRLAARYKARYYSDCVQIKQTAQGDLCFIRPTWQDKVYTTCTCPLTSETIATLRPGVIAVEKPRRPRQPAVSVEVPQIAPGSSRCQVLEFIPGDPLTVDLSTAERVVCGGSGVGGPQYWPIVEDLARALQATVGGSRMAADQGCIPTERMVGQTGKAVRSKLYLAAGVSGAYQHLGAVEAENLVAINTDRGAPIFERASLGVVGDLHAILPQLIRRINEARASSTPASESGAGG